MLYCSFTEDKSRDRASRHSFPRSLHGWLQRGPLLGRWIPSLAVGLFVCLALFAWPCPTRGQTAAAPSSSRTPKKPADAAQIERLIRQLGSSQFAEREAAGKALDAIGEPALPALRKAQENTDLEIRRRVATLLKSLARQRSRARAKAWDTIVRLPGAISSDTGDSEGRIGVIDLLPAMNLRDEDLALLHWLDDAKGLTLTNTQISDAGLVYIKTFYRLRGLELDNTKVTDAGLKHIGELVTLTYLGLNFTQVSDSGLRHLKALKRLTNLKLGNTRITDVGLEYLTNFKELEILVLSHTRITDAGLTKLKKFPKLARLDLSETQVTDEGLAHLKEIRTLECVWLNKTKVTDQGKAEFLKSLRKLGSAGR